MKYQMITSMLFAFAFSFATWADDTKADHSELQKPDDKMHAAHADCMKEVSAGKAKPMSKEFHEAMRKCLEGKGIQMPKPDPAREKAFEECHSKAKIAEGKMPTREQFEAVHQCMADKGFKMPPGMHGHGMHDGHGMNHGGMHGGDDTKKTQ